jgi:hypothetical protein
MTPDEERDSSNAPTEDVTLSAGAARRMARHRRRKKNRMTWLGIELRAEEIDVLIRRGWFAPDSRADIAAIRKRTSGCA